MSRLRACFSIPLLLSLACSNAGGDDDSAGESGAGTGGSTTGGTGGKGGGSGKGGAGGKGGTSSAGKGGSPGQGGGGPAGSPSSTGGAAGEAGESASGGTGASSGGTGGTTASGSGGGAGTGSAPAGSGGQIGNHTNPLSQALIDAFVAAHNAARARTDLDPAPDPALPPVSWDAMLADAAYNYLSLCKVDSEGDLVSHNDDRTEDYAALGGSDYVGENIFASSGTSVEPSDAVDSWMSEQSKYDYADGDFGEAGHYTQIVWRSSVRIGCAIVNCPNARFSNTVLCDYAPGGNLSGQKPY